MNLKQRVEQIKQLEVIDTPWEFSHVFGKLELYGRQVTIKGSDLQDFVEVSELQSATEWLVEQLGGKVKWSKK
jgi:hypothetical protein